MAKIERWGTALFTIHHDNGVTDEIAVSGRNRWALECLRAVGNEGCTPIYTTGPRWSACAHTLRDMGMPIETIHEGHDGPFKGTHARYVLRARVSRSGGQEVG